MANTISATYARRLMGRLDVIRLSCILRRDSPPKSSPTFSVRPRSSVGRVTEDQIRRSWVRFPPRSKDFFFTSCGSLIPFTRANAQWVTSWVQFSTLNYTSELILCSTICVHSATRHNIHMYPYFLFAAIHHLNRPRLSLSDLVAQSAE